MRLQRVKNNQRNTKLSLENCLCTVMPPDSCWENSYGAMYPAQVQSIYMIPMVEEELGTARNRD